MDTLLCAILSLFLLAPAQAAHDKLSCSEKELARMDCQLTQGSYSLRLLTKSVAWSDGTWHTVEVMPLKGEAVAWEKVSFSKLGSWPILQLWLWDKGEGELQVQSLHWFVADAEDRKFTILSEGIVRRRRPEALDTAKPGAKPSKPKYLYDGWENYSLKADKNGALEWRLNDLKKTFEKKQVANGV